MKIIHFIPRVGSALAQKGVQIYVMVILEMQQWKSPLVLQLLVIMVLHTSIFPRPTNLDLTFVELFAGKAAVSSALREGGGNGSSHDINISPLLDLTSTAGFLFLGFLQYISHLLL